MCSISASNWHFICTNDIANRNGHLEGSRRVFEVNRKLKTTWTTIGLDIYHSILVILTNRYVCYRPNQTKPKKKAWSLQLNKIDWMWICLHFLSFSTLQFHLNWSRLIHRFIHSIRFYSDYRNKEQFQFFPYNL